MPSIFLSYSHKDEKWKDLLKPHLGVIELDTWDDRRIEGGADWFEEIQEAMARASVAVLLISQHFLTSKFILGEEVPRLLQRRTTEGLPVIPVIVQTCAWDQVKWLQGIQGRPKDGRALFSFSGDRRNQEITKIATEIRRILDRKIEARNAEREQPRRDDDFLDRVEAVCRLREPDAEIQRYPGIGTAGAYLRVVRRVGAIRDMYPVGAIEHGLSRDGYESFLTELDMPYRRNDPGLISYLVYGGAPAPVELVVVASSRRVHLVSFVEYQGLIDFRTYLTRQTTKLAADLVYPPHLYVPQRMRTISLLGREDEETENALEEIQEWLVSPHGRFLVLLGDFGTGKTFLLHELARRMGESEAGLVPILLQMRSLEKGRTLDALLAQHFAQEGMESFSPARFRYMLEQGRIALLFDGFDELALRVTYAKAADHFTTLLQAAAGNAKVVLTSRRQHFLSESQVKTALTEQVESLIGHRLAILQTFHRKQVQLFLVNFFAGDTAKAEARLDLIDRVKDLLGLSSNPRLLGFIAELPEDQLIAVSAEGGEISAAKLYELLLTRWLEFEFDRVHPRGAPPGLSVAERWQAVTLLAMRLWQKTDRLVSLSDLSEEAARVVQAVGPTAPSSEVATFQLGSGTLLVRDDEGNFAFLHQSVLEWLVAKSAAQALATGNHPESMATREISPLMADFFASLAGREQVVAWARGTLSASAGEAAKKNALLVLERQKETIRKRIDLSNQDLRGQDLSGQDFSGADLSGADLTEARLVGAHLATARLVQAILREADLSMASLVGADLTSADLTGARLEGADLRRARLSGASLRRAKLLGAAWDTGSLDATDTSGATLDLSDLAPQGGTTGACSSVAWNPHGELLASASENTIRLWDVHSGRQIRTFIGHQDWILSVVFSPDGKSLASSSYDHTVRLWDVDKGRQIRAFMSQTVVTSVAVSPDGKTFASGSYDRAVRLWQVDSGTEIRTFIGHEKKINSVAFSPDGRTIASGSEDNTVRLWQVDSGQEIRTYTGHKDSVSSVTFSPDGRDLASGSNDKSVRLWQMDSGRQGRIFTEHQTEVSSVAFSPDGKILASSSKDNVIRLWQTESGQEIRVFKGQSWVRSVAFSPDGKTLASGSYDHTVRLWQVDSGRQVRAFTGHSEMVTCVAFSSDGKSLINGSHKNVQLWQVDSGQRIRSFSGHQNKVNSVAFSPDGKRLASGSDDNTIRLWQVDSGQECRAFIGHQSKVNSVAFSPDGKSLASGSDDNAIRFWQVDGGQESRTFTGHQKRVNSVAFSPDGKSLASGSDDNTIRLWQVDSGRESRTFTGHQNKVSSVAFSPDGKNLASGSYDKTVRLWQVASGRELRTFTGYQNWVSSVAFSPDGKNLASGSNDSVVRLWQMDSGLEIRTFAGHQDKVISLSFSPDGKSLASGSSDGVRLWDVTDGRCLAVLLPLPEGWVAFSPDGRYKFGGVPAGGFWHVANLCRFEIGELDEWVPGLRLEDDISFFELSIWKPRVRSTFGASRSTNGSEK